MSSVRCRGRNEAENREKEHAVGNCGAEINWRGWFSEFHGIPLKRATFGKENLYALVFHLRLFIVTISVAQTLRKKNNNSTPL